jgi:hypothetical protein
MSEQPQQHRFASTDARTKEFEGVPDAELVSRLLTEVETVNIFI